MVVTFNAPTSGSEHAAFKMNLLPLTFNPLLLLIKEH